ncbi:hypothetical protein Pmar_PMAR008408 [Perkinsus marinus ATCC 50983]|uniref:Uncharacterized protein n=1 Tax=Perkinsus marinus (strain ATCC 50983 / TXsc) TaxID=423536 RepID=C5LXK3_PERM5|nr:hypothetical protein Pmar_PMAR008408 [Perkinsus marinus ATCC 50983]EEQ98525.1 hypothetical protein Pmar_PMAR008408 [Perkinsus marinus ATCC 50983]|eukprot:XP_002765808.1 hypothetical protein Pmar_PMAR008408 [Perkinsus marinus ATCC 50983]
MPLRTRTVRRRIGRREYKLGAGVQTRLFRNFSAFCCRFANVDGNGLPGSDSAAGATLQRPRIGGGRGARVPAGRIETESRADRTSTAEAIMWGCMIKP